MKARALFGICTLAMTVAACSDDKPANPTTPSTPSTPAAPTLTAPAPDSPDDDVQLDTLRPSLRVVNATSNQAGAKTYEFQISDSQEFSAASASSYAGVFKVVASKSGIAEGADGKTSFEVPDDLQPTTRFYWRARVHQGATDGPWSSTRSFKTQIQGYNRPGELYDPLSNGLTMGALVGSVTMIPNRGAQVNTADSHVRYVLAQTLPSGEFSFEAEGIGRGSDGGKPKVMSMYDGNGDITVSNWRCTVDKRDDGVMAWRFIAGRPGSAQIDTDPSERTPVAYNRGATYFFKGTWGGGFRLQVLQGIGGPTLYDVGKGLGATYAPTPHVCFLGSPIPSAGLSSASVPGVIYRNVFIGDRPRPTSLGTALADKGISMSMTLRR